MRLLLYRTLLKILKVLVLLIYFVIHEPSCPNFCIKFSGLDNHTVLIDTIETNFVLNQLNCIYTPLWKPLLVALQQRGRFIWDFSSIKKNSFEKFGIIIIFRVIQNFLFIVFSLKQSTLQLSEILSSSMNPQITQ